MAGDGNDWWSSIPNPVRWIIIGALTASTGSGAINFSKDTSDRYKAADAARDFQVRDARHERLREKLNAHLQHSATYTEVIKGLRIKVQRLETELDKHEEKEHGP